MYSCDLSKISPLAIGDFDFVPFDDSISCEADLESKNKGSAPEHILSYRQGTNGFEYFVKFCDRPYRCCRWITYADFCESPNAEHILTEYYKKVLIPSREPYYDPSYDQIERIIGNRESTNVGREYFVKWTNLEYEYCTWEDRSCLSDAALIEFDQRDSSESSGSSDTFVRPSAETYCRLGAPLVMKNGNPLSEDQFECLNWLIFSWFHQRNCVVIEETGIGTTVQTIAFLHFIWHAHYCAGPFIIIAPMTNLLHWKRTFNELTDLNAIVYMGSMKSRNIIHDYEFSFTDGSGPKFDVVITSDELLRDNITMFTQFNYNVLIVDETSHLKTQNIDLRQISSQFRILLSTIHLLTNVDQLQSVLQLIHPDEFTDIDVSDIQTLTNVLQPHIFNAVNNPTISVNDEIVIECPMTNAQRQLYRSVLERNASFLQEGTNLVNIAMELRKVCHHASLIKGADEILGKSGEMVVGWSGKMIILDKLLAKLKEEGRRVLIFSPMLRFVKLVENYLQMVGIKFYRIDGKVNADAGAEASDAFVFLVSDGDINVKSVDTVIVFGGGLEAKCVESQRSSAKVYRLIAKGTFEENICEIATKDIRLGGTISYRENVKELNKFLRLSASQVLSVVDDEEAVDIDEILSRSTVSDSNITIDIDVDGPDFWHNLLYRRGTGDSDSNYEDVSVLPGDLESSNGNDCDDEFPVKPPGDDDSRASDWSLQELLSLRELLFRYGWGRWDKASSLVQLNRSVIEVKLGGRAILRWIINATEDLKPFWFACSLLDAADSPEFDPTFENGEVAVALDAEFMNQAVMIDPEFLPIKANSATWLRRLELLECVRVPVEKANFNVSEIVVPELAVPAPADWWTEKDDRCLIYETWKYGFARCSIFKDGEAIASSVNSLVPVQTLTERLRKLAFGIRKLYFVPPNDDRPARPWTWRERKKVCKKLLTVGVPLAPDGSHDWAKFGQICGLVDRTDEQLAKLVAAMMKVADRGDQHPDHNHDENNDDTDDNDDTIDNTDNNDDDDENGMTWQTARRMRDRSNTLTRLRRLFLKCSEEEISEYFSFLPRRRGADLRWTTQLEFVFFKELCSRGWGVCGEVLKMQAFEDVFKVDPPLRLKMEEPTVHRLDFILTFIEQNTLETLRVSGKPKLGKWAGIPVNGTSPVPNICYKDNGDPILPIHITSTACVIDLGHIVTDRQGFHSYRYIYPAGFKSSRLYFSTIDQSMKVRYTSEIIDTGGETPLFRVTMDDHPDVCFEDNSLVLPWNRIARRIAELRGRKGQNIGLPDYFGLSSPVICYLIQRMDGAEKCVNYVMRQFEPPRDAVADLNPDSVEKLWTSAIPEDRLLNHISPAPNIACDDNGAPKFPIPLTCTMYLIDLGHIVTDRPGFHNKKFIFPAGFKSSWVYLSTIDPSEEVRYTSEILDTGDETPLFRVTMDDHPKISFDGDSPSSPWYFIHKKASKLRHSDKAGHAPPGPVSFGLTYLVTCYLIQQMEGAKACVNYLMRPFGPPRVKARKTDPYRAARRTRIAIQKDAPLSDLIPAPKIAYDDNGAPKLPIHLSQTMDLFDLGHIVTDRPGFHNERYIYPDGFKSSRLYWSTIDPSEQVRYTSEILDTGGETPLFRVTMDGHPEVSFEGNTPSSPWSRIEKMVLAIGGGDKPGLRTSGPDCFGLSSRIICYLIQQMAGAEKCANYVIQPFEPRHM
jgi:chromodomain-helicase-DNA-binding protein 7